MVNPGVDPSMDTTTTKVDETTKEIVRVIEADHKATIELVSRLVTVRTGVRGVVITLASTVLGLSITQSSWPLAAFGIPIVILGYAAEARIEFLVRAGHDRAVGLERKIQAYTSTLLETGIVREDAKENFRREIETYQYGVSRSLRGPSASVAFKKSLRDAMTWVYLVFVILLGTMAISAGLKGSLGASTRAGCMNAGTGIVEIRELPTVRSGTVVLSTCPAV